MKIFKKLDRESLCRTPIELIRENIGSKKDIKEHFSDEAEYFYVGNIRIKSFRSGVHLVNTGRGRNWNVAVAFFDYRADDEYFEKQKCKRAGECYIRQNGENYDFSELSSMLDRNFKKVPFVRLERVVSQPSLYLATLFCDAKEQI